MFRDLLLPSLTEEGGRAETAIAEEVGEEIEERVRAARGPLYFLLYLNGERPALKPVKPDEFAGEAARRARRARRG